MRPTRLVLGLAAAQLLIAPAAMAAKTPPGYHATAGARLASGVVYQQFRSSDPELVHVVTVAPNAAVSPRVVLSNDQVAEPKVANRLELTSHACVRNDCVAGINGDYFCSEGHCMEDASQPEGGVVADGKMLRSPGSIGWQEQQLMFDRNGCPLPPQPLAWQGSAVSFDLHQDLALSGVNVDRGTNQIILYTPAYGPTTMTNQYGSELVLKLQNRNWLGDLGQTVQARPEKLYRNRGNSLIRPGTVVLSAHGKQIAQLEKFWRTNRGHYVSLRLDTNPPVWNSLGAKPLLLQNGKYTGQWAEKEVNPITIFAWKPDCTRLIIAVDGRQPGSQGVTNEQAANLAARLGATTAFGLDGGGSTTLVGQRGKLLNRPSDIANGRRVQRMVADSLLFVPKTHPRGLSKPAPPRPVAVGQNSGLIINLGGVEHLPAAILEQLSPLGSGAGQPVRLATGMAILLIGILMGLQAIHLRRRILA